MEDKYDESVLIRMANTGMQASQAAQELRGGFITTAEASKRLQRVLIQLAIKERKWYQFWKKNYKWTKK